MAYSPKLNTLLIVLLISFVSCTDILFQQYYKGPKGIDFSNKTCIVNDLKAPVSKEENIRLTAISMKFLNKMGGDSVIQIESLRNRIPLPNDSTGLVDSLRKYSSYDYLFTASVKARGTPAGDITVRDTDFQDEYESELYLDNKAVAKITIINIRTKKLIYEQELIATETVDKSDLDDRSNTIFTRSSENIVKNALTRALRSLKRHSKLKNKKSNKAV